MLLELQNIVLELMATGAPLARTAETLCVEVERLVPDAFCSVVTVDRRGLLNPVSAPSLPEHFLAALRGVPIGPRTGSSGTAAWLREPVIVTDIETDPLWADFRDIALPIGIHACWSSPIWNAQREVVGTFAFYYRQKRGPTDFERAIVAACTHVCSIAIQRDEHRQASHRLSYTDALTGLGNRASFNEAVAAQDERDDPWALLLIDLDDLKVVNDLFGHRAGDRLILVAAERIAKASEAPAFRLGGDEIAVILDGADPDEAERRAEAILAAFDEPAECDGHQLVPTATIGIAACDGGGATSEVMRHNADLALYHAKETLRGRYLRHEPGLGTSITRRLHAIRDVRLALDESRIEPFYQPLVEMRERQLVGMEALCRIRQADGEMIAASAFHEATSDAHIAIALTDCMMRRVAADARRWMEDGAVFRLIGINLSPADFYAGGLSRRIATVFGEAGVPLSHVVVEVTESVYLGRRDERVAREIVGLRDLGIRIALDDFGTGYASLSHLLTVPIDIIKIDQSFIAQLENDAGSGAIVNGLARIAEKLGINVVAEGVETEGQAKALISLGCVVGQGYHFASPMAAADATAFLRSRAQLPALKLPTRTHHRIFSRP